MPITHHWIKRMARAATQVALAAGLSAGPWAAVPHAAAAPPARPLAPTASTLVVNSLLDTNNSDNFITLREALLVANGGLTSGFSVSERLQLLGSGCTIPVNTITGGCGLGQVDTITFDPALGVAPVIALGSALPFINDSVATNINGVTGGVIPIINASAIGAGNNGLYIDSDNNAVSGLSIVSAPQDGIFFNNAADNNTIGPSVGVRASGRHGISVNNADNNRFESLALGVFSVGDGGCGVGNTQDGILIGGGSDDNVVTLSTIGCNGGNGVTLTDLGTTGNIIGPGNFIGTNPVASVGLSNTTGVLLVAGVQMNQVITNVIGHNNSLGVGLKGTNTRLNAVRANFIVAQAGNGVQIESGASDNQIGAPLFGAASQGNTIAQNTGHGVAIFDPTTTGNSLFNNRIGTDPTGQADFGNGQTGVLVANDAWGNAIGSEETEANVISGNGYAGVWLTSGAYSNYVQGNYIGTNLDGDTALPNALGVLIDGGAHDNLVGSASSADYLNIIAGNTGTGVRLSGSTTTTNTVGYNDIGLNSTLGPPPAAAFGPPGPRGLTTISGVGLPLPNGADGVLLQAQANHNTIGPENFIGYNGASGISLTFVSDYNSIWGGRVYSNTQYGIIFDNSSSNVISQTTLFGNGLDGIGERNGATANWWTEISIYSNGGLGIDKNLTSDSSNTITGPTPVITSVQTIGGNLVIQGTGSITGFGNSVEVYQAVADPSGYGEGQVFLGASVVVGGVWSVSVPAGGLSGCLTAFETHTVLAIPDVLTIGSEFGHLVGSCQLYLPIAVRS